MELARLLGDRILRADAVTPEAIELVERARDLVAAVVSTDVTPAVRARVADELAAITNRLRQERRDPAILLVRHEDGRIENLSQAGGGGSTRRRPGSSTSTCAPTVSWRVAPSPPHTAARRARRTAGSSPASSTRSSVSPRWSPGPAG